MDKDEKKAPVEDGGLAVELVPASIEANFDALEARVREMVRGYEGVVYDLDDEEELKGAKRDRTYLNGIAKEIDARRKAVKREYLKPLEAFEARANAVARLAKDASEAIKGQLDAAEEARRKRAYAALEAHYNEVAELLAPVVPYERIHDPKWLNKTFGEMRAKEAIEGRVAKIADDWGALKEMEGMPHYADAERTFFETLDLGAALGAARAAQAADDRIAAMKAEMAQPEPAPAADPEPAAEPAPAAPPAPAVTAPRRPPEPPAHAAMPAQDGAACPWVIVVPSATREQIVHAARAMAPYGVTGTLKRGTLAEVCAREVRHG